MFDEDIWNSLGTPSSIRGNIDNLLPDMQLNNMKNIIKELHKDSRKRLIEDYEQMITTAGLIRNILIRSNFAGNAVECFNKEDEAEDRIYQMTKTAQLIKELTILIKMLIEEEKLMQKRENEN